MSYPQCAESPTQATTPCEALTGRTYTLEGDQRYQITMPSTVFPCTYHGVLFDTKAEFDSHMLAHTALEPKNNPHVFENWAGNPSLNNPITQVLMNQDWVISCNYMEVTTEVELSGRITTTDGVGIVGAFISVNGYNTFTVTDGYFSLYVQPDVSYTLSVSATMYQPYYSPINVPPGGLSDVNITLNAGGCFIATAAYGTTLAPELSVLRRFRDHCLPNPITTFYYWVSPPIANYIRTKPLLRLTVRTVLNPIIKVLKK